MTEKNNQKRFGALGLIGATNAGKSTLINKMIGEKVAIISHKVQTTRFQIRGILTQKLSQLVIIDTPGFFKPRRKFDRAMIGAAWQALDDVDIVAFLVDASKPYHEKKQAPYFKKLLDQTEQKNRILILNKVDKASKSSLLDITSRINQACPFHQTFMISAKSGSGVVDLVEYCTHNIPINDWVYHEDDLTTLPNRLMAAEITREQIYDRLHQELPYRISVETETYAPSEDGKGIAISQIIIIEDKKHKSIVLGKQGQTIKKIGTLAREELMRTLNCPVHLNLYIQHRENWLDKEEAFSVFDD